jgi:hypothetical protein
MAKTKETVTLTIPVSITKDRLEALSIRNPGMQTGELLSGVATGLLADLADGGLMIEGHDLQRIADLVGEVTGADSIITPLEKFANKYGDNDLYTYVKDPVWRIPLQEVAEQTGRTDHELVQEGMNLLLSNTDWLYDLSKYLQDGIHMIYVDKSQWEYLKQITGRDHVTGEDVVEYLKERVPEETPVG